MKGHQKPAMSLARNLRIGLLGSPYDWGVLNFERFQQSHIDLTLLGWPGTREANRQDILLSQSDERTAPGLAGSMNHNEFSVLEWQLPVRYLAQPNPRLPLAVFEKAVTRLDETVLDRLKNHAAQYVGIESIIARYGNEVIRSGELLGKPQIHIENEALSYLLETPWRNVNELDYVIGRMVYYLEGDVLRKPYVQDSVYEFGTAVRGVSNSSRLRTLMEQYTWDVISGFDFQTASRLFQVQLANYQVELEELDSTRDRRRAA